MASLAPGEKPPAPPNYITPQGHARLQQELLQLLDVDRPEVVRVVQWAASNGDRSENADYQYGKRRLRQIDRRIRFLTQRLDQAQVIDPLQQPNPDRIFFGATVDLINAEGEEQTVRIVGVDEIDPQRGWISWISPVARALLKAQEGDEVRVNAPGGVQVLEVTGVRYESLDL